MRRPMRHCRQRRMRRLRRMVDCEIVRLSDLHDRRNFDCGVDSLNKFLALHAGQYERRRIGLTFVAVPRESGQVCGYYTLATGAVEFADLPDPVRRHLPRHRVPVVHLARLAVDLKHRGRRLGERLLVDALRRALAISLQVGVFAVEVTALDEAARRFYLKYGFESLIDDTLHLFLRMTTVAQLFKSEK
ncbi:MAG: N-acetyltransferase [Pirellula sp.]|nr:N-acetyltransferase [Pirellula sp.]